MSCGNTNKQPMEDKINQFIENQQKALADFKTQLLKELSPKTEFEVKSGTWVYMVDKYSHLEIGMCFKILRPQCNSSSEWFLVDHLMFGIGTENYLAPNISDFRPATESEVKEALIKEAEKRYGKENLVNGLKIKGHWGDDVKILNTNTLDYYYHTGLESNEYFGIGGLCLYWNGSWATIAKEEAIKIGGYEVMLCKDASPFVGVTDTYTTIDGHKFTKDFWESALKISEHSKAGVWVGCGAKSLDSSSKWYVSPEQIKSILEKLK